MTTPVLPFTDIFLIQDAVIVNVQGNLTVANIDGFRHTSQTALAVASSVIVNLEKATFLDSAAIGALVGLAKEARLAGGEVWLASVPVMILSTLKLLRLDTFFQVMPDLQSCLIACRKRSSSSLRPLARPQH